MQRTISQSFIVLLFVVIVVNCFQATNIKEGDIRKGVNYLLQHNYDEAIDYFEEYLKQHPNSPAALTNLGLSYWNVKNYVNAFYAFYRSVEVGSNSAATHTNFAGLLCTMYPRWNDYKHAVNKVFKQHKVKKSAHLKFLLSSNHSLILTECENEYRAAMSVSGNARRRPLFYFAKYLQLFGEYEKSISVLKELLRITEKKFQYDNNDRFLDDDGEDEKLEIDRVGNDELYLYIAKANKELNNEKEAIYWAKQGTNLHSIECGWFLVSLYCDRREYRDAALLLKNIADSLPDQIESAQFFYYQAIILSHHSAYNESISSFSEIIDRSETTNEDKGDAYFHRGLQYNIINDYNKAWDDITQSWIIKHSTWNPFSPSKKDSNKSKMNCVDQSPIFIFNSSMILNSNFMNELNSGVQVINLNDRFITQKSISITPSFLQQNSKYTLFTRTYPSHSLQLFNISNAYVITKRGILRGGDCEQIIVPSNAISTNLFDESKITNSPFKRINGTVVTPLVYNTNDKYSRLLLETFPKLCFLKSLFFGDYHSNVKLLVDSKTQPFVEKLKIDPMMTIHFHPADHLYFDKLKFVDWSFTEPRKNVELESVYYPPSEVYSIVKNHFVSADLSEEKRTLIIYAHRSPPFARSVNNHQILIDLLNREFGDENVLLFEVTDDNLKEWPIEKQAEIFRKAKLLIGPHGSALANLVFTAQSTALIEFRTENNNDNFYAYMCEATGRPYLTVPSIPRSDDGNFIMSNEAAEEIVESSKYVLSRQSFHSKYHDEL